MIYFFLLFGKFGIGHLLSRLSLEKHDGVSASELILSLCLSRIVGESIHRICKPFSYVPMFFLARRTCLSVIVSSNCLFCIISSKSSINCKFQVKNI